MKLEIGDFGIEELAFGVYEIDPRFPWRLAFRTGFWNDILKPYYLSNLAQMQQVQSSI